jgi:hypothetical protein
MRAQIIILACFLLPILILAGMLALDAMVLYRDRQAMLYAAQFIAADAANEVTFNGTSFEVEPTKAKQRVSESADWYRSHADPRWTVDAPVIDATSITITIRRAYPNGNGLLLWPGEGPTISVTHKKSINASL